VSIKLACGIIAFSHADPPLASSIPAPMLEPELATSLGV
jgi:hypothetical protein